MSITAETRLLVRERAGFACEFCSITETDTGGELTIDHYQPKTKGGSDDLENLIYSCIKCNAFKSDYWSDDNAQPVLWNPRIELANLHLIEASDGLLYPLTATGRFTIERLRLNRPPLVKNRLRRSQRGEELVLLQRYSELVPLPENMNSQMALLMNEQQALLKEQRDLLRLLLRRK